MPSGSTVFVDTNVLLYAQDPRNADRQEAARAWLTMCWQSQRGRISTQVLNELYANLRKVAPSLSVSDARAVVVRYRAWAPMAVDDATVDVAWSVQDRCSMSFWDALIVAAAQVQGCAFVLSEDMQHEQRIDSVQIINPFLVGPELLDRPA
jgi:predicted nucleic acid-binding protein